MDPDETPLTGESNCVNCDRPDSADNLVQCDRCSTWWHMKCAGVTNSVEDRSWSCSKCVHVTSEVGSVRSVSSAKSKRLSLAMKNLQEEYELKVKQLKDQQNLERDLLEQKYACFEAAMEENESDSASARSRMSDGVRRTEVQRWFETMKDAGATAAGTSRKPTTADQTRSKAAIKKTDRINQWNSTPMLNPRQKEVDPPRQVTL
ncbi:uncharacterized protein LOC129730958 [Wyeomyia smithii]|uniref:uncharacterized protein LOC129730958 n=1 Tax=Wyeomyia smithii TaxID=174621 RepID=UPI002467DF85|nr:uncharacterized protein LOC129730958 [Wyeomyia smithii]